jgi:hypothetical protein
VKKESRFDVNIRQCNEWLKRFKPNVFDFMAQFRLLQSAMEQFKAQDPEGRYDVEWNGDGTLKSLYFCPSHSLKNFPSFDGPIVADGKSPRVCNRRAQSAVGVLQAVDTPTLFFPFS